MKILLWIMLCLSLVMPVQAATITLTFDSVTGRIINRNVLTFPYDVWFDDLYSTNLYVIGILSATNATLYGTNIFDTIQASEIVSASQANAFAYWNSGGNLVGSNTLHVTLLTADDFFPTNLFLVNKSNTLVGLTSTSAFTNVNISGASYSGNTLTITGASETNAATIAPNFSIPSQLWATNAAFTFGLPLNLNRSETEGTVVYVTNSTGTAWLVTPPTGVRSQGVWYCTNVSVFSFSHYGGLWTNAVALPLW